MCHGLVRMDPLARLLAVEEVLEQLLDLRDARRSTNQDHLIHLVLVQPGVSQHLLHWGESLLEQICVQLLKPSARERLNEVVPLVEAVDLNPHLVLCREGSLGPLHFAAQCLQSALVPRRVRACLPSEELQQVRDHAIVEILTSKVRVPARRLHLENPVVDREQRDVEGAAAQVEHENVLLAALLVESVRDRSSGRLI
mmetsp:Transcript_71420/g.118694  ORF Transcript_71420/g.118694 Transcript_71420/m.118694 type:complete len:198 (-) Transcript_71420:805-1398(-)